LRSCIRSCPRRLCACISFCSVHQHQLAHLVHAVLHVNHALSVRVALKQVYTHIRQLLPRSVHITMYAVQDVDCSPRWRRAAGRRESSSRRWGTWTCPGRCTWTGKRRASGHLQRQNIRRDSAGECGRTMWKPAADDTSVLCRRWLCAAHTTRPMSKTHLSCGTPEICYHSS